LLWFHQFERKVFYQFKREVFYQLPELAPDHSNPKAGRAVNSARPALCLMTNTLEVGGSERQFVALVEALSPGRFDVKPACLRRIGGLVSRLGDIPEFPPGGSLFGMRSLRARMAMGRYMRQNRCVIAHAFDFYTNLMMAPSARMAGVAVVLGSHRQLGDLLTRTQFWAQLMAFRMCDRVLCNSRAAADRLRHAGIHERKLEIIPNGIPEELFALCAPAIPRRPGAVRFGMIARMNDPVKNHPAFLRAAARVSRELPEAEFLLVGDGPLRPGLETLAQELGIAGKVIFAGERHDIPAVLSSMDVSVLISSSESLSNAILESMAAGVPVIATDVGGNPELVRDGDSGMLVPPGNEDRLVEAMLRLARDSGLRLHCSRAAREFARSSFHIDVICRRYEELYLSLLVEKGVSLPHQ
jgi:glycosyltransferase involved in cell wall biosynthesis